MLRHMCEIRSINCNWRIMSKTKTTNIKNVGIVDEVLVVTHIKVRKHYQKQFLTPLGFVRMTRTTTFTITTQ